MQGYNMPAGFVDFHRLCQWASPKEIAAARSENPGVLLTLLPAGADIDAKNGMGMTPLMAACQSNSDPQAAKALIDGGADVHARDNNGKTPLLHYVSLGSVNGSNENIMEMLINTGSGINASYNGGSTVLMKATGHTGNGEVVRILLKAGADFAARKEDGATALHLAAEKGARPAALAILLKSGAITQKDSNGNALLKVSGRSPLEAAELLIKAGADIHAPDNSGETPLMAAADADVIATLIKAGAGPGDLPEGMESATAAIAVRLASSAQCSGAVYQLLR